MADWLLRVLKGALVGTGAILPGISGGTLCVVFGIYQPMMGFLAHPVAEWKRYGALLLPVLIGWIVGFVGLSRALGIVFGAFEIPVTWLFIGLVAGTMPSLLREAGKGGRPRAAWLALACGVAAMTAVLLLLKGARVDVQPSFWAWILCGVLWGLGIVVPGLSPSTLFVFFGLTEPMSTGIGSLDFSVILPMLLGIGAVILLFVKPLNALLKRAYATTMHAVAGVAIASTVGIIPLDSLSGWNIALYAGCFAVGCVAALGMDKIGRNLE